MQRLTFSNNSLKSQRLLQILYSDLWGPLPLCQLISIDIMFYSLTNSLHVVFTLKLRKKVLNIFQTLHPFLEKQFQTKQFFLYTDSGGEFQSFSSYLKTNDIEYLVSPP